MPHKAEPTVICQCGAIISKYYMPKHLRTAKHARDVVGCEKIEVVAHYKYVPRNRQIIFTMWLRTYAYTYVHVCKHIHTGAVYANTYIPGRHGHQGDPATVSLLRLPWLLCLCLVLVYLILKLPYGVSMAALSMCVAIFFLKKINCV